MTEYSVIGNSVIRKDALEKATGKALFSADVQPRGMLYGKLLTSPYAHAIIKKIDTSKAEALPGVIGVITGRDAPEDRTDGYIHDRHILPKKRVRYVGDPVAAVAAISNEVAYEALELIEVEYEELPAVFDPAVAFEKNCPVVIHEGLPDYHKIEWQGVWTSLNDERPNQFIHRTIIHGGDVDEAFAKADLIYEDTYELPRAQHCSMEPHACVVQPEQDGGLTIWASEQGGCFQKYSICEALGLSSSQVRMIIPYLGGGFGGKVGIMITPIAALLAMKTKRPVRLEMTREEVFVSGNPRSPGVIRVKDGVMKDGTLVARKIYEIVDGGAYSTHVTVLISAGIYGATGTYRVPNLRIDSFGVYTNNPPTGPYRSLGSELLCFAIECQMDRIAEKLGIDKFEIRRKNVLVDGDVDGIGQITYNNGTLACLNKTAEFINLNEKREPEGPWVFGKGISTGNKFTSYWDTGTVAICKVHDDGTIEIRTFHVEMGQGAHTVLAQVAAEEFGVSYDKVKIVATDSAIAPYDEGTYCSRGTYINGNAVRLACQDAKRQVFEVASEIMNIPADQLDTKNGKVFERANPDNFIPFFQLYEFGGFLKKGGEILGKDTYLTTFDHDDRKTGQSTDVVTFYSYGALGFEVAVNKETGEVKILKCCGFYDMGQPLNPKLVENQLEGAMVMGIGQAIFEEQLFNDRGKVINPNFRDYRIPTMLDVPYNDSLVSGFAGEPHRDGPYGAKGIGEVALVPVMPAVANAINDALGIQLNEIPLTRERLMNALRTKSEKA